MADSDDEYHGDSGDEYGAGHSTYGTRSKDGRGPKGKGGSGRNPKGGSRKAAWEDIQRSWEDVAIAEDGTFSIAEFQEAEKRRRLMRDTTPLQRGIIRHLMLVIDMSVAMAEKDILPNRYILTLAYSVEFVREYFEQNPISQLGIIGMRDGIAVRVSDMGGNPAEHIEKLRQWAEQHEPQGNPSLQNALEMCRGALFHTPSHGTREVLIIYGALLSSDPGDMNDTIANLIADRIRISIVGLAAQVAICAELCKKTNNGDDSRYHISLHEQHFRELFLDATTPPVTHAPEQQNASLLMMGFPSRALASKDHVSLCACHHRPSREGYACTRCRTKVCRLPAECPACGLTLILSTHLARSYHHLFPLKSWIAVPWSEAKHNAVCFSCETPFPQNPAQVKHPKIKLRVKGVDKTIENVKGKGVIPADEAADKVEDPREKAKSTAGVSESGRYKCQVCENHFCIDCDVFSHEIIHNCPGCQSDTRGQARAEAEADGNGAADGIVANGGGGGGEAMVID